MRTLLAVALMLPLAGCDTDIKLEPTEKDMLFDCVRYGVDPTQSRQWEAYFRGQREYKYDAQSQVALHDFTFDSDDDELILNIRDESIAGLPPGQTLSFTLSHVDAGGKPIGYPHTWNFTIHNSTTTAMFDYPPVRFSSAFPATYIAPGTPVAGHYKLAQTARAIAPTFKIIAKNVRKTHEVFDQLCAPP